MDIKISYTESGAGEPLILLHGNSESGEYFKNQIAEFSKYFRVICPDTRGHGKTERGRATFTINQFAEDLNGFMEEIGVVRAHILGFSDGANIALTFAIRFPEKTGKLIADGANLFPGGLKARIRLPVTLEYLCAKIFSKIRAGAAFKAEMLALMVRDPHICPAELASIRARTLVVAGSDDLIKRRHTELIYSSIPGAELRIIEGDHFLAYRRPEEFNSAVLEFLMDD